MRSTLLGLLALLLIAGSAQGQDQRAERLGVADRPELRKLSSQLLEARRAELAGASFVQEMGRRAPDAVRDGAVQVILSVTELGDGLRRAAADNGLVPVAESEAFGLRHLVVRCVSSLQLEPLAARADVLHVLPEPAGAVRVGSVTSQADASMMADALRTSMGVDGTGIEVGILSDTFNTTLGGTIAGTTLTGSAPQTSGDLPPAVEILDPGPSSGIDEGAAMAELVYDVAPGAAISFASAFTTYLDFATNVTDLVNAGADVVVDDVIYFAEPMFQDGPIALAAAGAVASGVPFFSSAGNRSDLAHAGPFVDSDGGADDDVTFPPTGVDFHDFGGGDRHLTFTLVDGGKVVAALHWDQPYGGGLAVGPGSAADLDLHVVTDTVLPLTDPGNVAASSTMIQGDLSAPNGDAYELVELTNSTGSTQTYHLVIDRFFDAGAVTPGRISLILHQLDGTVVDGAFLGARTVYGHTNADTVTAVAAIDYREVDAGGSFQGGSGLDVEDFSALGGFLPVVFDGNGLPKPLELRFKPELTAPDGTDTTFFFGSNDPDGTGFPNFFGTSAAAPHAAAVTALLLELEPSWTPTDVATALQTSAVDVEGTGIDSLSGAGLVDALAASTAELRTWVDFLHAGVGQGTPVDPFDALGDAVAAAATGGTIAIRAGSSSAGSDTFPLTITKAVTLTAEGGTAVLGQ